MKYEKTAKRLIKALSDKNMRAQELANKTGISKSSISQYVNGSHAPSNISAGKMAAVLEVSPLWLMGFDLEDVLPASGSASDSTTSQLPTAFHALHGAPLPMLKNRAEIIALIDRYPDVHDVKKKSAPVYRAIACGEPIFMQEQCDTYALIDADIDIDFCIIAKGESMTGARIQDGDIVFIKRCSMVDNGDIAAVAIDDTATLKRVYYDHDAGQLILQAENPAYAPMVYRGEELNNIIILGKAMYFQSAVR